MRAEPIARDSFETVVTEPLVPINQFNIDESIGEAVLGMQVGGIRTLHVPPEMAYGQRAIDDIIPADSSMQFIIELVRLEE